MQSNITYIKYKHLLEGIGHQVILKIISPLKHRSTSGSGVYTYNNPRNDQASSRLKQLIGLITLFYTSIILTICFGMGLVYLIWPEEQHLIVKLMLTALPVMVVFTFCILICYIYLNRRYFWAKSSFAIKKSHNNKYPVSSSSSCSSANNFESSMANKVTSMKDNNAVLSINDNNSRNGIYTPNSTKKYMNYNKQYSSNNFNNQVQHNINIASSTTSSTYSNTNSAHSFERNNFDDRYHHQIYPEVDNLNHKSYNPHIVDIPNWVQQDTKDMEDPPKDYLNITRTQERLSSQMKFLQHVD